MVAFAESRSRTSLKHTLFRRATNSNRMLLAELSSYPLSSPGVCNENVPNADYLLSPRGPKKRGIYQARRKSPTARPEVASSRIQRIRQQFLADLRGRACETRQKICRWQRFRRHQAFAHLHGVWQMLCDTGPHPNVNSLGILSSITESDLDMNWAVEFFEVSDAECW